MLGKINPFAKPPVNPWNNTKNTQAASNNKANPGFKIDKFDKPVENKGLSGLSEAARSLLEDLKKKFGNVEFIVAQFSTSEEANRHLGRGNGDFNCVITPELLERMAADADVREKYEGLIGEAIGEVGDLKEALDENGKGDMIRSMGITVDADGKIEYHVMLLNSLPKSVNDGNRVVKAGSIEELMKKLDEIDEERRQEKNREMRDEKLNINV